MLSKKYKLSNPSHTGSMPWDDWFDCSNYTRCCVKTTIHKYTILKEI